MSSLVGARQLPPLLPADLSVGGIERYRPPPMLTSLSTYHHIPSSITYHQHTTTTRTTIKVYSTRRRVRYNVDEDNDCQDYGHNIEITMLESYSEGNKNIALLVHANVDEEEEEVLIFKGFSSPLSSGTFSDPSRSILPARAVIKSIDIVEGPFNPSKIEYLEKNLSWEDFKTSCLK